MLIRNSWYVAAWSEEVGHGRPFGRTIVNEPIVMYRSSVGDVVALEGRCAHRHMPLAHGKIVGDTLVCCYHCLTYGYPAVERYGAIWLWMGDPQLADEAKIFDCSPIDPAGERAHKFYWHVKANYLYLNDNLSDLLHQAYLHNPSFGGNTDPLGATPPTFKQQEGRIYVDWDWSNVPVPTT
jgi:phenylpropionate dioxygenase-like ring-hydroxylating dioxygenase large terminal subunit